MASSKVPRSLARAFSDCDVKKLDGLSRTVLTFLPVAKRPWVMMASAEVFWRARRFCRTPAESVMDMFEPFWSTGAIAFDRLTEHAFLTSGHVIASKKSWLIKIFQIFNRRITFFY